MNPNYLLHNLIYASLLPLVLSFLCLFLPPFFLYNFILKIYHYLSKEDLNGKVVLITGASSGIGEQMAYEYAKKGASLAIVARREKQLEKVAERARALGSPQVLPICADVSNINDCKRFVDEAVHHFGRLDHLVNNAGVSTACLFEDVTAVTNFAPVMDINFWGCIYPTYYAIPHLKRSGGKIVVNSSNSALVGAPNLSFYGASKAALLSFYNTLRMELGASISITIVLLGFVDSEMTQGKHLSKQGVITVKPQITDVLKGLPVMSGQACAEAIIDGVRRRERYVSEPKWYKLLFWIYTCCPQLIERIFHQLYRNLPDEISQRSVPLPQNKAD
ncbi:hypothetical protein LguiA_000046 [Lonicera macranthoides]